MRKYENKQLFFTVGFIMVLLVSFACEGPLEMTPKSELAPANFLNTEKGINSVLFSAYSSIQFRNHHKINTAEWPSRHLLQRGGGQSRRATLYMNFTWDATENWWSNGFWDDCYEAIRDANIVLDNVENVETSESRKSLIAAEARFVRASAYFYLFDWFGPTPLVTSSNPETLEPSRSPEEEIKNFIESEYTAIADILPSERPDEEAGRGTKGAALGMLTKFYLNTKQWQKSAQTAKQIMDMGIYELHPDYFELFQEETTQNNNEFIFVHPTAKEAGLGTNVMASIFPPNYPTPGSHVNWAAHVKLADVFVNSFDPDDERLKLIVTEYEDLDGNHVQLLGNDESRPFKYWPNENSNGLHAGHYLPEVRFADILLSRAEALNEINGPSQESILLINRVRRRAGISDLELSDFSDKDQLNEHILQEREREFYYEAKRRQDEIRHGVFISDAQSRGKNAQPHHVLFPLPQSEMDANPNLEQNPGY
ncbi:Starch-binding associating with outer membrane [Fodinibius roseus]|uniref:Starch-binding associating with outer membrane n=1 Tax=Fodinibius roseus TaxID=1194090 RepID=A0A1M5KTT6_9BACT|nr:RagB/SusD family nutrient uptake outer membrane protein [Fodinibius roseus]SHG56155.1 Starch-binding associating with outer membrane [Fodinibius roseus]